MSPEPLRVCHLITYLGDGGAERIMLQTVQRLAPDRFSSTIASLREPGPMSDVVREAGLAHTHLRMRRHPGPATIIRLAAWLRAKRIDVVHAYLYHATILGRLAGRVAGVPVIITSTRCSLDYLPRPAWWVDRWTAPLGNRIVAVSRGTADFITHEEGISGSRVAVIPNGVDLDRFRPGNRIAERRTLGVDEDAYVICVIGRLHEQKGHEYLFQALANLRQRIPKLLCLIAGDGPLATQLREEARRRGIADICRFLGRLPDTRPVYAASDLCVLPSLYEGMPNVVLEAMAMGRPVVATRVAGSDELIVDGATGFLVPSRDGEAIRDAVSRAYDAWRNDDSVCRRIRSIAEAEHGLDRMVRSVESLYEAEWARARRRRRR